MQKNRNYLVTKELLVVGLSLWLQWVAPHTMGCFLTQTGQRRMSVHYERVVNNDCEIMFIHLFSRTNLEANFKIHKVIGGI